MRLTCAVLPAALLCSCSGVLPAPLTKATGLYVTVAADGHIFHSQNGMDWTGLGPVAPQSLRSVAFGNGVFVAVGARGTVMTSTNGTAWSPVNANTTTNLEHVVFSQDTFVTVGGSWESGAVSLKSTNGVDWETMPSPENHMFHAVARHNGHLVAAAYYRSDLQTPSLFFSAVGRGSLSGEGWTAATGPDFYDAVEVFDGVMVAGGSHLAFRRDVEPFVSTPVDAQGLRALAAGPPGVVALGEGTMAMFSADGQSWSGHAVPATGGTWFSGAVHGDAGFVAVGSVGSVVVSSNGRDWTAAHPSTRLDLMDVAFGVVDR